MSQMDRNSWSIVKKFLIVKCKCCDEMIGSDNYKCGYCKNFWCHDHQPSQITNDDGKHMCHDCQMEYAMSVFKNQKPIYKGDGTWKNAGFFKDIE